MKNSVLILATALSAGCGASVEVDGELESVTVTQDINNADRVSTNVAPYNSVVRLYIDGADGGFNACSGLKISSTRFLTAAHCLTGVVAGQNVNVSNEIVALADGPNITVSKAYIHPSYAVDPNQSATGVAASSYDVGVIETTTATNAIPALSNPLSSSYAADGQVGMLVAYGANVFEATGLQKQSTGGSGSQAWTAASLAQYGAGASAARYTHYLLHVQSGSNRQWSNKGDSGGPDLVQTSPGVWQVMGVLSFGESGVPDPAHSGSTRVSNVRLWISNPHNYTDNIVAANATGFIQNRHMLQCIGTSGSPLAAGIYDCDGRKQPTDNQYWKLVAAEAPYYRLQNNKYTDFCLQANTNPKSVTPVACANLDAQKWQFVASSSGSFQLHPKSAPTECLDWNTGLATPLSHATCNSSKVKDWYFYR
jgi:hypothetical protein